MDVGCDFLISFLFLFIWRASQAAMKAGFLRGLPVSGYHSLYGILQSYTIPVHR